MYTSGHEAILRDALKRLGSGEAPEHGDVKLLLKGLKYPDFPCGSYQLDAHELDAHRHDGHGRLGMSFKRKSCSLFQLLHDVTLRPNIFASAFASHNGYFSVWHSMTYDPQRTVGQITRDIIDQVLSFLLLAVSDDTPERMRFFWLGMALHVVMDAYSPAHVLRVTSARTKCGVTCLQELAKAHPAHMSPEMQESNIVMRELKDRLMKISVRIGADDARAIADTVADICARYHITSSKDRKQLENTAHFLFFHNHQQNRIKRLQQTGQLRTVSTAEQIPYYRGSVKRPIVTYYYYPQQSSWFHKWNDRVAAAKQEDLYESAVRDTVVLMRLHAACVSRGGDAGQVADFLQRCKNYLVHVTFKLAQGSESMRTGVSNTFYTALKAIA